MYIVEEDALTHRRFSVLSYAQGQCSVVKHSRLGVTNVPSLFLAFFSFRNISEDGMQHVSTLKSRSLQRRSRHCVGAGERSDKRQWDGYRWLHCDHVCGIRGALRKFPDLLSSTSVSAKTLQFCGRHST